MREESYDEYRKRLLRVYDKKHYGINKCHGIKEAFRWVRKNKWLNIGEPVDECLFYEVVRRVNNEMVKAILNSDEVIFPYRMGRLLLVGKDSFLGYFNGKVVTNRGIDWKETLKLWYEDEECERKSVFVRHDVDSKYRLLFDRKYARFNNRSFYHFRTNRSLKKKIVEIIKEGKIKV